MTTGQTSTTRRRRLRSCAEQMFWDQLTPAERVAFTVGYSTGQGNPFPRPDQIDVIRRSVGAPIPRRQRTPDDLPPLDTPEPGRRHSPYALDEVAAVACQAIAAGQSPGLAVQDTLGCPSYKAATMLIAKARKRGHRIPYLNKGAAAYAKSRGGAA